MIEKWLIRNSVIHENEKELYRYALKSVVLNITPIIIAAIFGIAFQNVVQSVLIVLPYTLIRKYSGGLHLKNVWLCAAFSVIQIGMICYIVQFVV